MAALRNLATPALAPERSAGASVSLLRLAGETNIAAACRRCAAQPWAALALIGIPSEN